MKKIAFYRVLIRKYGNVGCAIVGLCLLLHKIGKRRALVLIGLFLAGRCLFHAAFAPATERYTQREVFEAVYAVLELGGLPQDTSSVATGINASGEVVGWSARSDSQQRAVLWKNSQAIALGTLTGFPCSHATALNNKGQAVGYAYKPDVYERVHGHAFCWQNGKMRDLGTLGGPYSDAYGINDTGSIVGIADIQNNFERAFAYRNGKMQDLGALSEHDLSVAYGINAKGLAVGYSRFANFIGAVLYKDGNVSLIPNLGGKWNIANAINDKGQIVGWSNTQSNGYYQHAFLYDAKKLTDLGTLGGGKSEAKSINNKGQIVGWSYLKDDGKHLRFAFLWQNGKMGDLNTLLPKNSGWILEQANGINDTGQIVGVGKHNGKYRGFLLTPTRR